MEKKKERNTLTVDSAWGKEGTLMGLEDGVFPPVVSGKG